MKNVKCLTCGCENGMHLSDGFKCDRCGSLTAEDGSASYDPTEIEENISRYDQFHDEEW